MDENSCDVISSFILAVKEYNVQKSEIVTQKLYRYLQILSSISDNSILDPNYGDGTEFYVSLHELMSGLDSKSGLMWYSVSVLEDATKNPAAHYALVHTFKFTPILTQLLSGHLIKDKQLKVLQLLQEFTFGIKILWQDSHLPLLISTLVKYVTNNNKDNELVALSLGILVNLCYKNLPAVYTLRKTVDIKEFIRCILSHKEVLDIKVQAYRMLIILEELTGEISDEEILSYVTWTFKRLQEAFESKNAVTLRHLVSFFKDITSNNNFKQILLKYKSYSNNTEKLLQLIRNDLKTAVESGECMHFLLEFFETVILLQVSGLESLYEPLIELTVSLSGTNSVFSQAALQLACTIMSKMQEIEKNNYHATVIARLDAALPILLGSVKDRSNFSSKGSKTALLQFLSELSLEPSFREVIINILEPQDLRTFITEVEPYDGEIENIFDESFSAFYLQGLSLICSLAQYEASWKTLCSEMLKHRKLQVRLAAALYAGTAKVKLQILQLISRLGYSHNVLADFSLCMEELNSLVVSVNGTHNSSKLMQTMTQSQAVSPSLQHQYASPLFSVAQESRLDQCISAVHQAINNNELGSVGTAAVLELYQYRVAAMSHTECVLQNNLQAMDSNCTQLRHRLAATSSEINRLLSVLNTKEQSVAASHSTITRLQNELIASEKSAQVMKKQHQKEMKEIQELKENIKKLNEELQKVQKINMDHLQKTNDLENVVKDLKNIIQTREKKIEQLETHIVSMEKTVCDKDDEIAKLEAMRDVILKVTMGKK